MVEEEEGAYGVRNGKIELVQLIVHAGEVNRARYSPANPNLIATRSPSDKLYVFDKVWRSARSTHTSARGEAV